MSTQSLNTNWSKAKEIGMPRGAYHFFTFCSPGKLQAELFTKVLNGLFSAKDLRPVIDIEYGGNCKKRLPSEILFRELDDFLEVIRSHSIQDPILYITQEIYYDYFEKKEPEFSFWIRSIAKKPPAEIPYIIWQYSNFSLPRRFKAEWIKTY